MSIIDYANNEMDLIKLGTDDVTGEGMDYQMRTHILRMVKEFADEGHSGSSAAYALSILKRLLDYKPLSPLTGEDSEWRDTGDGTYQNKRASSVFKNSDGAYWSTGIVFWSWYTDQNTGEKYKSYYTSRDSKVRIESFPWTMPDSPEYRQAVDE